mmetsp:Transcript_163336/g.523716  ORF Transcript_163336/g.523716 Transcript_163336/m.523716 type:complete len:202 (-) Transcript_163336:437-1042(-)
MQAMRPNIDEFWDRFALSQSCAILVLDRFDCRAMLYLSPLFKICSFPIRSTLSTSMGTNVTVTPNLTKRSRTECAAGASKTTLSSASWSSAESVKLGKRWPMMFAKVVWSSRSNALPSSLPAKNPPDTTTSSMHLATPAASESKALAMSACGLKISKVYFSVQVPASQKPAVSRETADIRGDVRSRSGRALVLKMSSSFDR